MNKGDSKSRQRLHSLGIRTCLNSKMLQNLRSSPTDSPVVLGSRRLGWRNYVMFNQKRPPLTAKHKTSRDDNSHQNLPKQLSSDSLPLKTSQKAQAQQLPTTANLKKDDQRSK